MPYDEYGDIDQKKDLYQKYYEASKDQSDFGELNKREIASKIEHLKEIESWNSGGS